MKYHLIFILMLLCSPLWADVPGDDHESWGAFTQKFQNYFDKNKAHFETIVEVLLSQPLNDLRMGDHQLMVQWNKDDAYENAPPALNELLYGHFKAIHLFGVRSINGSVYMLANGGGDVHNNVGVSSGIVYNLKVKSEVLCSANPIADKPDDGVCLWPMATKNWYVEFYWYLL